MLKHYFKIGVCAAICLAIGAFGYALALYQYSPAPVATQYHDADDVIAITGSWNSGSTRIRNTTGIYCSLPTGTCSAIVAELVPDNWRTKFQVIEKPLLIVQASDRSVTATGTSTDPCRVERIFIDRQARVAKLEVGPSDPNACGDTPTYGALLPPPQGL